MRDLRSFPGMLDQDRGLCFIAAAVVTAGVASAGASVIGSSNAAGAETSAANQANATQQKFFNATANNLKPFMAAGGGAQSSLNYLLGLGPSNAPPGGGEGGAGQLGFGSLIAPINMDEATLQNTPGYQFNLSQGLKGVENSAAARGLGTSGAALKGAAGYATGLADSTYQNQFANAVTNQTNAFQRLSGISALGENAAAGLGNNATATGANIGNNLTGAGNAQAASDVAGSNAVGSAFSSIPNSLLTSQYLGSLQGGGLYGGSGPYGAGAMPADLQGLV